MNIGIKPSIRKPKGYIARGGRMLNYRTYVDLMDLLSRIPSVTEPGMTAEEDTRDFDAKHRTFDKARLMEGGKGIIDGGKLGFNNKDRILLTKLIAMPDSEEEKLDNITIEEYFKDDPHFLKQTSGLCGKQHLLSEHVVLLKNCVAICIK